MARSFPVDVTLLRRDTLAAHSYALARRIPTGERIVPFVKLDTGILDSTLWLQREVREVFITALLMALPRELREPVPQLAIRSLDPTGWSVPAGWYGWVDAAGAGIVTRALVPLESGLAALEVLGAPEATSRSRAFDGRRLARVDGGFVVLNWQAYREKDHTAAARQRRYRERKAGAQS